jgi:hypothetical protein
MMDARKLTYEIGGVWHRNCPRWQVNVCSFRKAFRFYPACVHPTTAKPRPSVVSMVGHDEAEREEITRLLLSAVS